ncbi:MAG: MBL fold metallo-hydrolase [Bacteriovoracales bacterium]
MNTITILGSGTSTGIPMVGCHCEVCSSSFEKNKRTRTSILIQTQNGHSILIDTTPDLRTQLLNNKIEKIDAVVITHEHADHLHGIDDLRPLNFGPNGKIIPVYTFDECAKEIRKKFDYIFKEKDPLAGSKPMIDLLEVKNTGSTDILGEKFYFYLFPHGPFTSLGFRYEKFAYLIDLSEVPENIMAELSREQIEILIIDCVQKRPHKTHLNLEKCFSIIKKINPKICGLIHMNHELEHQWLEKECKKHFTNPVFPVFDGQKLQFGKAL